MGLKYDSSYYYSKRIQPYIYLTSMHNFYVHQLDQRSAVQFELLTLANDLMICKICMPSMYAQVWLPNKTMAQLEGISSGVLWKGRLIQIVSNDIVKFMLPSALPAYIKSYQAVPDDTRILQYFPSKPQKSIRE